MMKTQLGELWTSRKRTDSILWLGWKIELMRGTSDCIRAVNIDAVGIYGHDAFVVEITCKK